MLSFDQGGLFHLPLRCQTVTRSGDLCDTCMAREAKTNEKVAKITGTTIIGSHPTYLMGRVTDPIPYWSRIYDGAWFRLKLEEGFTLSEQTMAKVKNVVEKTYEGVTQAPPAPIPKPRSSRKKLEKVLEELPVVPSPGPVVPGPVVPKKRKAPVENAMAIVQGEVDTSEYDVLHVTVRKQEVDGRLFYLDPKKDKLYDMKFKYVGRLKDGAIASYPDSDQELD